ncbi:MAG: hypothetical protein OCC45_08865 [Desulfotalea sp.]
MSRLKDLVIVIKGTGEMASGIAWRLYRCGFRKIILLDTSAPVAVRRLVSFSEAIYDREMVVDGLPGRLIENIDEVYKIWSRNEVAVIADPS